MWLQQGWSLGEEPGYLEPQSDQEKGAHQLHQWKYPSDVLMETETGSVPAYDTHNWHCLTVELQDAHQEAPPLQCAIVMKPDKCDLYMTWLKNTQFGHCSPIGGAFIDNLEEMLLTKMIKLKLYTGLSYSSYLILNRQAKTGSHFGTGEGQVWFGFMTSSGEES